MEDQELKLGLDEWHQDRQKRGSLASKATEVSKTGQPVSIRGLNPELYLLARVEAMKEHKNIGQWLNEAIKEKLESKGS